MRMRWISLFVVGVVLCSATAVSARTIRVYSLATKGYVTVEKVKKTEAEWRKVLTPEQYEVTRRRGTERACSGLYWEHHDAGTYSCVCCGLDLFSSNAKFDSGTGWPSFFQPVAKENVIEVEDRSFGMVRTEILCAKCDAHLGHVFEDGPRPTGLRFCLNSLSLKFTPAPGSH
jgi:peptide-methionine (R)-S-oxide reductase